MNVFSKKEKSRYSLWSNIKFLVSHSWQWDKVVFFQFFINTVLAAAVPLVPIFMPKFLIDELTKESPEMSKIIFIVVVFLAFLAIANYITRYISGLSNMRLINLRMKFLNLLSYQGMTMDFQYTEDSKKLNKFQTASRAGNNNRDGLEGMLHDLFGLFAMVLTFSAYIAIVISLSPWILIFLVVNVLIVYFVNLRVGKYEDKFRDQRSEYNRKTHYIENTMFDFSYGKDIRIYNLADFLTSKFNFYFTKARNLHNKIQRKHFKAALLDIFLLLIQEGIVYAYLIYQVIYQGISLGNFSMYFTTISGFANWMNNLAKTLSHLRTQSLSVSHYREFLDIESESEVEKPLPIPEKKPYQIEFKNVSFKYPNSKEMILKDLSITIKAGQSLALVGKNGAGKTTFIKLLARLYEPTEGEILLNGININKFSKKEYYKLISVVFQEIKILAFSVATNVSLKRDEEINLSKVKQSLQDVDIYDKISGLDQGIDHALLKILQDDGIELSGGENQKIALARALYKDGDIIILDEPTAALDALAEEKIYNQFNKMIKGKTAIYISHRLASTRFCDNIAFFQDGKILEFGTHEELLGKNARYAEMFNVQSQYYKTGSGL